MGDIALPLDLARQGVATAKAAIDEGEAILQRRKNRINVAAVVAMMNIAHAAKREGLRKAAYRDLGLHLRELRQKRDQAELATISAAPSNP